jgi:hypothetical protein
LTARAVKCGSIEPAFITLLSFESGDQFMILFIVPGVTERIKQPFLLDNLKSILGLFTLALLYRIGSCRNEETIDNENVFKQEKKQQS